MKFINVSVPDKTYVNTNAISHFMIVEDKNRLTDPAAILIFLNGNTGKTIGEQDFTILFDSIEDAKLYIAMEILGGEKNEKQKKST